MILENIHKTTELAIGKIPIPQLGLDLITCDAIKSITILDDFVCIELNFAFPIAATTQTELKAAITTKLMALYNNNKQIKINITWQIFPHKVKAGIKRIKNLKNIIAIASGKGGVGKSTVCVNLALSLHKLGAQVGILDADIYGPTIPRMLGVLPHEIQKPQDVLAPVIKYGIATMSLAYLLDDDKSPAIWRGPMTSKAMEQMLQQTLWPKLDYLLVDLPPGTGDIQLTLAQKIPLTASIVVSTPQQVATKIAAKAIMMFNRVDIPILGLVENMGMHTCTKCGHNEAIFGHSGGKYLANDYNVALLGELPLDCNVSISADGGMPTVLNNNSHLELNRKYMEIATKVAAKLATLTRDHSLMLETKIIT